MKSRMNDFYKKEVRKALKDKFGYENDMLIPKIEKVVINSVSKDCVVNSKVVETIMSEIMMIAGQKPVIVKAKSSIATFKVRKGQALGAMVTLRAGRMYEFLDKFINLSLPRVRDFKGLPRKGFDRLGNYNLGLREQIIFPESNYDKIDKVRGLNLTVVTTAKSQEEGMELLRLIGFPFRA
jgi:large subunit ribosomal protein L5